MWLHFPRIFLIEAEGAFKGNVYVWPRLPLNLLTLLSAFRSVELIVAVRIRIVLNVDLM